MDSFNVEVTPDIVVRDGKLYLYGSEIREHAILNKLGEGANGVVFLAKNRVLNRDEALKVWFPARKGDSRDKLQQGLQEVMKLAAVNGRNAVQNFTARIEGQSVVASMEYVPGETLKDYCERMKDISPRIDACYVYLDIIERTTTPETRHGDPHWKNVLVFKNTVNKCEELLGMKLCDFGTSVFSGQESSEKRHWSIVEETIMRVTADFPGRNGALAAFRGFQKTTDKTVSEAARNERVFTAYDLARMRTGAMRDYLDFWRMHRFPPESMSVS